jgi:predicted CoA-binding protein
MPASSSINDFLASKTIAVVGVSRNERKFGNAILNTLRTKGYHVVPVNRAAGTIAGEQCYPDLRSLPAPVDGVITVVPPAQTAGVVRDAVASGIKRVWMQQGSVSDEAVRLCEEHGISCVRNECILMYAAPVRGIHAFHRWLWRLLGKLPRQ